MPFLAAYTPPPTSSLTFPQFPCQARKPEQFHRRSKQQPSRRRFPRWIGRSPDLASPGSTHRAPPVPASEAEPPASSAGQIPPHRAAEPLRSIPARPADHIASVDRGPPPAASIRNSEGPAGALLLPGPVASIALAGRRRPKASLQRQAPAGRDRRAAGRHHPSRARPYLPQRRMPPGRAAPRGPQPPGSLGPAAVPSRPRPTGPLLQPTEAAARHCSSTATPEARSSPFAIPDLRLTPQTLDLVPSILLSDAIF